jgi:hypothetical protein
LSLNGGIEMKLVVGYDRDLAVYFFRRNLHQLIHPGDDPRAGITVAEVEYFADKLAETSVFSRVERLGNPWTHREDARELARLPVKRATRLQLQQCELVANNLLILEGVIGRVGAFVTLSSEEVDLLKKKLRITEALFQKAALGTFRSTTESAVLRGMSRHTYDWVRYLSLLKGHDYLDQLSTTPRAEQSPFMS